VNILRSTARCILYTRCHADILVIFSCVVALYHLHIQAHESITAPPRSKSTVIRLHSFYCITTGLISHRYGDSTLLDGRLCKDGIRLIAIARPAIAWPVVAREAIAHGLPSPVHWRPSFIHRRPSLVQGPTSLFHWWPLLVHGLPQRNQFKYVCMHPSPSSFPSPHTYGRLNRRGIASCSGSSVVVPFASQIRPATWHGRAVIGQTSAWVMFPNSQ